MKHRIVILSASALLALASCGGNSSSAQTLPPEPEKITYTAFGNAVREEEVNEGYLQVQLWRKGAQNRLELMDSSDDGALEATFQEGDSILIEAASTHIVFNGFGVQELLLFSPRGSFCIEVPKGKMRNVKDMNQYLGHHEIDVRLARDADLSSSRNLALNPFDVMHIDEFNEYNSSGAAVTPIDYSFAMEENAQSSFPHAYASRVTRNEVAFFPANAIDGVENAEGHEGYPYQSWGYDQKDDATFTLYFGREVELDSLGLILRHDTKGNHDCAWSSAVFEYDKGEIEGQFVFTGGEQRVEFDSPVRATYLRIKEFVTEKGNSQGYAALTEIKAYGRDVAGIQKAKKRVIEGRFGGKNQDSAMTSIARNDILSSVERANSWFLESVDRGTLKIPMYDITRTETVALGEQEWKDSIYYSGLMDYVLTSGDAVSYEYLKGIAESYLYRCNGGDYSAHGDWYQIGETYMQLGDLDGTYYPHKQAQDNLDWIIKAYPNAPTGSKNGHQDSGRDWTHGGWWWCDALYMAMNSYTLMGRITGEAKYVELASNAYDYAKAILYDEHYHLWHRDTSQLNLKTDVNDPETGNKYASFWSRGNAWVFAALAKQLLYLDESEYPEIYKKYSDDFIEMANALATYQRDDGLWNVAITPYRAFEGKEITGTCGFIYGFAVGSALGILDEKEYLMRADDAYQTVIEECFVGDTDQLGYMQTVGYQPQNYVSEEFTRPITDEFGMGLFLLASSALLRMTPEYEPMPITVTASRQGYYFA